MEENKPTNFKEAALSHIPASVVESMRRQSAVSTEGMSILEALTKNGGPKMIPEQHAVASQPVQKSSMSLAVDGRVIRISLDPTEGAVTMLLYLLATVWSKDKKIAKVLKQFNFHFFDENKNQLYPLVKTRDKI